MKRHVYLVSIVIGIVGGISIAIGVAKLALAPVFGIGIFGLGVLCLGWALTLIVVERLHREVVRREEAVPKASDRTAAGASKRRRRWGAIYALVAGMVATSLVVAIVIVVPAFQIQYNFIIPAPEIVSGPQDHVSSRRAGSLVRFRGPDPTVRVRQHCSDRYGLSVHDHCRGLLKRTGVQRHRHFTERQFQTARHLAQTSCIRRPREHDNWNFTGRRPYPRDTSALVRRDGLHRGWGYRARVRLSVFAILTQ